MTAPVRKPTNLSLDSALLAQARSLDVNLSRAAESGIKAAVAKAAKAAWQAENRAALELKRLCRGERATTGWLPRFLMAQYNIYELPGSGLVVDVQSDLLDLLTTCVVIPFAARDSAPTPARRLNPVIIFDGQERVLVPQFAAVVQCSSLRGPVGTPSENRDEITAALDMVFQGV